MQRFSIIVAMTHGSTTRPRLVCLLPARNAAADLPGYFASVERFVDAIVALDDGSTDATADLLAAHPLVAILLRNPRRPDYRGWNDAANRNRLLAAAAELAPDWIISLDADERIDPADAAALRDFLATDALPGCAYGFQCFPMQRDLIHYLPTPVWVYRLFAFAPGQRFPDRRLHFSPVPTSIPRQAFIRTTLRIQHLGNLTPERRRARYEKYRQADPHCAFWPDYSSLLDQPDESAFQIWQPRSPDTPILLPPTEVDGVEEPESARSGESSGPAVSIVILATSDDDPEPAIASVISQHLLAPVEIILVTHAGSPRNPDIRQRWPSLPIIELAGTVTSGRARNAGLHAARSRSVLFLTPDMELMPGALAALVNAHNRGYALVTGRLYKTAGSLFAMAERILRPRAGAPPSRSAVVSGAPDWCSYSREALLEAGGFPEDLPGAEEIVTNHRLRRLGYLAYREADARLAIRPRRHRLDRFLAQSFWHGVAQGRVLLEMAGAELDHPSALRQHALHFPVRRARLIHRRLRHLRAPVANRIAAAPLVALGELAAWTGLARAMATREATLLATGWHPAHLVLLIGREGDTARLVALLRVEGRSGAVRAMALPLAMPVSDLNGQTVPLATAAMQVHSRADALATAGDALGLVLHDFITVDLNRSERPAHHQAPSLADDLSRTLLALTRARTVVNAAPARYRRLVRETSMSLQRRCVLWLALRAAVRRDPALSWVTEASPATTADGGIDQHVIAQQVRAWLLDDAPPARAASRWEQLRELPLV